MIEQLTPQQQALIPVYREKWRKIALSTEPIDREKATQSVRFAYAALGYKEPQIVICDSPCAALYRIFIPIFETYQKSPSWRKIKQEITAVLGHNLTYQMLSQIVTRKEEYFWFYLLNTEVYILRELVDYFNLLLWSAFDSLERSIDSRRQITGGYTWYERWRKFDRFARHQYHDINKFFSAAISRGALSDFYISVLNGDRDTVKWRAFQLLVANCAWIYPLENTCILCDRPRILSFDSEHRLHAEGGPAILFADGYSLYAYHGVTLPEKYGQIHPNEWRSEWLLSEDNTNLKKILIQTIDDMRLNG
ncbi:DUF6745 domain-containing protein [Microcoleus sp. Pol12B4]|uniref:DUF6745 domain-containing protein n=1 Tax=Microcoleus sp. Pol12B4 TaxID=3055395 RepID=UPI002FD63E6C